MDWINDLKYYLLLGDSSMISNYYFTLNDYEESILMINILDRNDLFLDIGSNHGHYTLLCSKFTSANVISIEPVKATYERLKKNIKLNNLKNIEALNLGVSSSNGYLKITKNRGSMNRILAKKDFEYNEPIEKIKVTTIDTLLRNRNNISMIKIDVEGYEKQVLGGAINTLKNENLNVIIIELNGSNKFYDYDENEIIFILKKHRFKPYLFDYNKRNFIELKVKNFKSYNTIFIRNLNELKRRIANKKVKLKGKSISIDYN